MIDRGRPDLYIRIGSEPPEFSSSPWLLASSSPEVDEDALCDMLAHPLLPAQRDKSLLRGIARVPHDAKATVRHGVVTLDPAFAGPVKPVGSTGMLSSVVRLTDALLEATERAVHGAKCVAVVGTGGLDSALVAALVREVRGEAPVLITAAGGLTTPSEDTLCRVLASHLSSDHVVLDELPDLDRRVIVQGNRLADFPIGGIFTPVWEELGRIAEESGCDSIVTGEGGNEIFSPGGTLSIDLWRERRPARAAVQFGRARSTDRPTWLSAIREGHVSCWLPTKAWNNPSVAMPPWCGRSAESLACSRHRWRNRLSADVARGISISEAITRARLDRLELWGAHAPSRPDLFRHPLADLRVVSAVYQVPIEFRSVNGVTVADKHLARMVARQFLPASITEHPKVGPANQVSALLARAGDSFVKWTADATSFLGLDIDDHARRPQASAAMLGLDWTTIFAFTAWAEANLG